ncbi:hypothetical protein [Streptomyces morookaense]|uniref:Uncharacterized protein n=1 Tax=Streptomyces morookaense TaxID=1970 RepID=A0A7Y7B3K5_STRMO|nr:hypothetical protein [Streptomyces morookaense]NVK78204.1 hypothetical protein [Streptomyces morookaense]GHF31416.1 hypothetical protein GCM10010359_37160 [Streptomyces morookaense]
MRCDGTWPEDVAPSVPLEDGCVRIDVPDGSTIGELVAAAVASGVTVLDIDRISVDADAVLRGILEDHR